MSNSAEAMVQITNKLGLHVHPSEVISNTALHFLSKISILRGREIADARSVVALTALGPGSVLV